MHEIWDSIRGIGEAIGYLFIAALILYGLFVRGSTPFGRNRGAGRGGSGPYRYDRSAREYYDRNLRKGPDNN
jgi:hypothetical protein